MWFELLVIFFSKYMVILIKEDDYSEYINIKTK